MIKIGQENEYTAPIELVMHVRHQKDIKCKKTGKVLIKKGTPTGRTISKVAHTGAEIADFWNRNKVVTNNKKRKPDNNKKTRHEEKLPEGKEAQTLLEKVNEHAEKMAKERNEHI